jgi:hypothetical protein
MCLGVPCLPSGPEAEQGADDDGAAGEDADGPPERGVVAVCQRQLGQRLAADETRRPAGATPKVPVLIDAAITVPVPIAARISEPSTPAAYPVCGPNWASQTVPAAVSGRMPV